MSCRYRGDIHRPSGLSRLSIVLPRRSEKSGVVNAHALFTAALRLGCADIILYCKRTITNISDLERVLIKNWNAVVWDRGEVCGVGDFAINFVHDPATAHAKPTPTSVIFIQSRQMTPL